MIISLALRFCLTQTRGRPSRYIEIHGVAGQYAITPSLIGFVLVGFLSGMSLYKPARVEPCMSEENTRRRGAMRCAMTRHEMLGAWF